MASLFVGENAPTAKGAAHASDEMTSPVSITVAIPTYGRDHVLVDTIRRVLGLLPVEVIVLDQTTKHIPEVERILEAWDSLAVIRWLRLSKPHIPGAMNLGLLAASQHVVLFLDDDIIPNPGLLEKHLCAIEKTGAALVAGRVVQPWQEGKDFVEGQGFHFASMQAGWICEFMGTNFAVRRDIALRLGGFDEQFLRVAYNFEAEFAYRLNRDGYRIFYEPEACIHHLRVSGGGTRAFGDHLKSYRPNHSVGAYYFILRTWSGWQSLVQFIKRPLRAVATKHHLRRPWWIPVTLVGELSGMAWALVLARQGPRYLNASVRKGEGLQ
jgi:GT2 family glycosyltransferase